METGRIFACIFFCLIHNAQSAVKLKGVVLQDADVNEFAKEFAKENAVTLKKPLPLAPPENCKSARCLLLFYTGCLIGELAVTDLQNSGIKTEVNIVDVVEVVGYGDHGALGLVKAAVLVKNGRTVVVVPMPRPDGSRGNYGYIGKGSNVDSDYEIIEEYVKKTIGVKFDPFIDDKENADALKAQSVQRSLPSTITNEADVDAWITLQLALRDTLRKNLLLTGCEKLACKCIGDSYIGSNIQAGDIHRMLASYSLMAEIAQKKGARIVSTKAPTGFTAAGFLKKFNFGNSVVGESVCVVPQTILTVTLQESLLVGLKEGATFGANIDKPSTKLPGTSILVGRPDFENVFLSANISAIVAKLKAIPEVDVNVESSVTQRSCNGSEYTLIKIK